MLGLAMPRSPYQTTFVLIIAFIQAVTDYDGEEHRAQCQHRTERKRGRAQLVLIRPAAPKYTTDTSLSSLSGENLYLQSCQDRMT